MELFPWERGRELGRLRDEIRSLWTQPFRLFEHELEPWQPRLDVFETENEVVVEAELPGIRPADTEIRVSEDALSLQGKRVQEEQRERGGYIHRERRAGSFFRTVALPVPVDPEAAEATYRQGIFEVRIPKVAQQNGRGRRVEIREEA